MTIQQAPSFAKATADRQDKQKIIIFDFMRTLYDPDEKSIVRGALELLKSLRNAGFILILISTEIGNKADPIAQTGITPYFEKIILTREKSERDFKEIQTAVPHDPQASYVIGDRVRGEIKIGNLCGYQTIWVKKGKFAAQLPRTSFENPRYIVTDVRQVEQIIA